MTSWSSRSQEAKPSGTIHLGTTTCHHSTASASTLTTASTTTMTASAHDIVAGHAILKSAYPATGSDTSKGSSPMRTSYSPDAHAVTR